MQITPYLPLPRKYASDGASPDWGCGHCSLLLIYLPRKDERPSRPGWLTYSGRFTHISGHPSAAGRAQDSASSPVRDRRSTTVPRTDTLLYVWLQSTRMRVFPGITGNSENKLWAKWFYKKLSCRRQAARVALRVSEKFAKSLMVTHGHSKLHRWVGRKCKFWDIQRRIITYDYNYSYMPLKFGLGVIHGHWKCHKSMHCIRLHTCINGKNLTV